MKLEQVAREAVQTIHAISEAAHAKRAKLAIPTTKGGFKGFLLLHSHKGAALVGVERGHGLAFKVLDMLDSGVPRLSAPLIVSVSKVAVGLQLGYSSIYSLALLHTDEQVEVLAHDREAIVGRDLEFIGLPKTGDADTASTVHHTSLTASDADAHRASPTVLSVSDSFMVVDLSFYGGGLSLDKALMAEAYGPGVEPLAVLRGQVEVPGSLKPTVEAIAMSMTDLSHKWGGPHED